MIPEYGEDNVGSQSYSRMSQGFPSTEQMVVSVYTDGGTNALLMLASSKGTVLVAEVSWFGWDYVWKKDTTRRYQWLAKCCSIP